MPVPINKKELNAKHIFSITIRDMAHFYKIVEWLNKNVGRGVEFWTLEGRVKRGLIDGRVVSRKVYIYVDDFDITSASYLSLI